MAGFNPNVGLNPVAAYVLGSTRNFQAEQQNRLMELQFMQLQNQYLGQKLTERAEGKAEVDALLDTVDNQKLLPLSQQHLNKTFTDPWREKIYKELHDDYAGDYARYKQERLPYVKREFTRRMAESTDFQNAVTSKTNYALAKEAMAGGKVSVGSFEQKLARFAATGGAGLLESQEFYEPPKQPILTKLQETNHNLYPEGIPVKGKDGKTSIQPVPISAQAALDATMEAGLSRDAAIDWLQKAGFKEGQYFHKLKRQDSWDAQRDAVSQAQWNANFNYRARQDAIDNQLALRRDARDAEKDSREKAGDGAGGLGSLGIGTLLTSFEAQAAGGARPVTIREARPASGMTRAQAGVYRTDGLVGQSADAALSMAGIRQVGFKDDQNRESETHYFTQAKDLYSPDLSKRYPVTDAGDGQNVRLYNIDTRSVYWRDNPDGVGKQPFLKAHVKTKSGGEALSEVFVPMATSAAAVAATNAEFGVNDSKIKANQTNIDRNLRQKSDELYRVERQNLSRQRFAN